MAWSRLFSTCTSVTSASTPCSSASVWRPGPPAHATRRVGASSTAVWTWRIESSPGLRLRGAVVAVREGEAGLVLVGGEALASRLELPARDDLEHVPLPGPQPLEALERIRDARAQAPDLVRVADVAVRRRLPRPDERLVLRAHGVHFLVELAQVLVGRREPLVVPRLQGPGEHSCEASDAEPEGLRLGAAFVREAGLRAFDPRSGRLLVRGGQVLRPRGDQHVPEPLIQVLALLEAQAHLGVQLPEAPIDVGQQGLVILPAEADQIVEGVQAALPRDELLPDVLQVQIVLERRLEVVRRHQARQIEGL